jgi:TrpR-related protein YerC/YecD
MENFSIKAFDELFEAVLKLDDIKECRNFFEDVCTIKELQDMTQRLEVAKLLSKGKNYQEISKATGASTATISRVNKCLVYGKGGYKSVIGEKEND